MGVGEFCVLLWLFAFFLAAGLHVLEHTYCGACQVSNELACRLHVCLRVCVCLYACVSVCFTVCLCLCVAFLLQRSECSCN